MGCTNTLQFLLVTILVAAKVQCQNDINFEGSDAMKNVETSTQMESRSYWLSREAQRSVEQVLQEMPSGWPQFGIPPMAPYTNENLSMNVANDFINFQSKLKPLRIAGLNNMNISKLSVSAIFRKVSFDFIFPKITVTGKFDTALKLPFISAIANSLSLKGNGDLDLGLEQVRLSGSFKYLLPLFMGSSKLNDFKTNLGLKNVQSRLRGSINAIPISQKLNALIESYLLKAFNGNTVFWSSLLEQTLLPRINAQLQGTTLWNLIKWSMGTNTRNTSEWKELEAPALYVAHQRNQAQFGHVQSHFGHIVQ